MMDTGGMSGEMFHVWSNYESRVVSCPTPGWPSPAQPSVVTLHNPWSQHRDTGTGALARYSDIWMIIEIWAKQTDTKS